jgi:hypothetical protein
MDATDPNLLPCSTGSLPVERPCVAFDPPRADLQFRDSVSPCVLAISDAS